VDSYRPAIGWRVQESDRGYRRVTGGYRRVQDGTGEYRRVTGGYRRVQESTGE
jgi:hypothetical protein